ncbi:MAG: hypothetical protein IKI29_01960 [Clostridia bacterium]|nr:hypothetical protein [Clostridia bacterium]
MTGNEILNRALLLLGYSDSQGNISAEQRIKSRALSVLNAVYADLFYTVHEDGFVPLVSLSDPIQLPEKMLFDIMPYGVASFLAMSESDGDNQQVFTVLYNQKRAGINQKTMISDVLPTV